MHQVRVKLGLIVASDMAPNGHPGLDKGNLKLISKEEEIILQEINEWARHFVLSSRYEPTMEAQKGLHRACLRLQDLRNGIPFEQLYPPHTLPGKTPQIESEKKLRPMAEVLEICGDEGLMTRKVPGSESYSVFSTVHSMNVQGSSPEEAAHALAEAVLVRIRERHKKDGELLSKLDGAAES